MGCWDESIYGGDASLLWKESIYELCKSDEYGSDEKAICIPRDAVIEKLEDIEKLINESDTDDNDKNIGYQVFAAILMHSGYDLHSNKTLESKIVTAIDEDTWSAESPTRLNAMKNFKKTIKEYDFSEPINILGINLFVENEDDDEEISKEFKEVFGILNGRVKKLESGIEESSKNKDYDDGFKAAAEEEIDFLKDFKELLGKQEMMGILLERINKGLVGSNPLSNTTSGEAKESSAANSGGKDVVAG